MKVYSEEFIKRMMVKHNHSQTEVISYLKEEIEAIEKLYPEMFPESGIMITEKGMDVFIDWLFLTSVVRITPYLISPALAPILSATPTCLKLHYLMDKLAKKLGDDRAHFIAIQSGSVYGNVLASQDTLVLQVRTEKDSNSIFVCSRSTTKNLALDDLIDEMSGCYAEEKAIIYKALSYIACSGNPDFRKLDTPRRLDGLKKRRKAKNFSKAIMPRIMVGLGFEKSPLYQKGQWIRKMHYRNQPYGPKENPTHYELILIGETTVTRKK